MTCTTAFGSGELVKNADENGPTAARACSEVTAVHPRVKSGLISRIADRKYPCSTHRKRLGETQSEPVSYKLREQGRRLAPTVDGFCRRGDVRRTPPPSLRFS